MKRLSHLAAVLALLTASNAFAQDLDVVLVTDSGAADPLNGFINSTFTNINSFTIGNFTNANGDAGQAATLSAADVIVVSRDTNSGNYDDGSGAEMDFWNGLSGSILLSNGYISRNSRWDWVASGDVDAVSAAGSESNILDAGSQLLAGVDTTGGSLDLFDDSIGNIDQIIDSASVGDGNVVLDDGGSHIILASWEAGDALPLNGPGSVSNFGGDRILFGMDTPSSITQFTADGEQVFIDALASFGLQSPRATSTAAPEPASVAIWSLIGLGLAGLGYYRARRKQ